MEESLITAGFNAQFSWFDSKGQINQSGNCELRLYENALLILPQKNEPIRVPYCYVSQTSKIEYSVVLNTEFEERFEFSKLGEKFDAFGKSLSDALNKMMLRSQTTIKEMIPETDPLKTYKLAALMKDGRAAKRKDIDTLSTDLWRRLIKRAGEAGHGSRIRLSRRNGSERPRMRRRETRADGGFNRRLHMATVSFMQFRIKQTAECCCLGSVLNKNKRRTKTGSTA